MTYFDDIFDRIDELLIWGGKPPEKVRKARENLEKAREEYKKAIREAQEEQLEKDISGSMPALSGVSLGGSEDDFRSSVERVAKANPNASVKAESVNFPNGYYRSVRIEEKG